MSQHPSAPAERTLKDAFRQRRLSVRSMDWTLKLATGAAVGCMLGAIVLIALRDRGDASVTLGVTHGVRTIISSALFYATLALLAVGLGYLLSGLTMAHRVLGLASVCLLAMAIGVTTAVVPLGRWRAVLPGWAAGTTRALLAAMVLVAVVVMVLRHGRHGDHQSDRRLRAVVLFINIGLVGAYLVLLHLFSPTLNGLTNFPATVDLIMIDVALLVTPMLQIAALDVAEWGEVLAERVQAHPARWAVPRWLVPAAGSVALIAVGVLHRGDIPSAASTGGQALLLLVAGLGLMLVVGRLMRLGSRHWPERANVATLFVAAVLTLWVVVPLVGQATGELTVHPTPAVTEDGEFTAAASVRSLRTTDGGSLLLPTGWEMSAAHGVDRVLGVDPSAGIVRMTLARYSQRFSVGQVAGALGLDVSGRPAQDGELTRVDIATGSEKVEGQLWTAPAGEGGTYVAYATVTGQDVDQAKLDVSAVLHSLRPAGEPAATIPGGSEEAETPTDAQQATTDRLLAFTFGVSLVLSIVALALLATVARRWAPQSRLVLLIFPVVSLFSFLYFADSLGRVLLGPSTSWPAITRDGLLISTGLLALLALVATRSSTRPWARRLPHTIAGFVGAALALVGAEALYSQALAASRVAIWAAVVVLAAVVWDVVMSGESLTNHSSRLWSRSSRLLTFFGYVILVAATVVYYSGQRSAGSGEAVEAFFEPELVTRNAFFRFAFPVVVLLFLLRTFCVTTYGEPRRESSEPVEARSR